MKVRTNAFKVGKSREFTIQCKKKSNPILKTFAPASTGTRCHNEGFLSEKMKAT